MTPCDAPLQERSCPFRRGHLRSDDDSRRARAVVKRMFWPDPAPAEEHPGAKLGFDGDPADAGIGGTGLIAARQRLAQVVQLGKRSGEHQQTTKLMLSNEAMQVATSKLLAKDERLAMR